MAEKKPRAGWEKAFKTQPDDSKSTLLIGDDIVNQFDKAEWDWEESKTAPCNLIFNLKRQLAKLVRLRKSPF